MFGRTIRLPTAAAAALLVMVLWAPGASAGGGCHQGATEGRGDTVEMVDACFTPTIIRVKPGAAVAFVNRDPVTHNVSANGWGHFDDMAQGDAFTATFNAEGVYPFACSYHPGMTGAVIVDRAGAGSGELVTVRSVLTPAETSGPPAAAASETTASGGGFGPGLGLGAAIGLAAGAAGMLLLRRRRA